MARGIKGTKKGGRRRAWRKCAISCSARPKYSPALPDRSDRSPARRESLFGKEKTKSLDRSQCRNEAAEVRKRERQTHCTADGALLPLCMRVSSKKRHEAQAGAVCGPRFDPTTKPTTNKTTNKQPT